MNLRSLIPARAHAFPRSDGNVFGTLQREVDRLFDEFARGFVPPSPQATLSLMPKIDVAETDKEIEISAELPGLERKDVEISLEDDVLTIRGEKKSEMEKDDKNRNYHVTERNYGVFYRMLQMPPGIDPSTVQATMSNGLLKIKIPKPAHSEAKKIEIKDAA